MDNTNSNKCYTIIAGLAALLLLGVCDKVFLFTSLIHIPRKYRNNIILQVKLSFLVMGHTHCDIDRIIGLVAVYMRTHDVITYEDFERFAMESFKAQDFTPILGVETIIAMTDYDQLFDSEYSKKDNEGDSFFFAYRSYLTLIIGYMAPAVFRLSLSKDKQRVICYYKTDVTTKGMS